MKSFLNPIVHTFPKYLSQCSSLRCKNAYVQMAEEYAPSSSTKRNKPTEGLLAKILTKNDERVKKKLISAYMNTVTDPKLKSIPISYLLRLKCKKTEATAESVTPTNAYSVQTPIQTVDFDHQTPSKSQNPPRPIRQNPGEVIWGFIPKEWTTFVVPITGHSGFYTFLVTFTTYLLSKEIYVCDHEFYNGISMVILYIYIIKKKGPEVARYLDREIDKYEQSWNSGREKLKQNVRDSIYNEIQGQQSMDGQFILINAKRENVHLQREGEFRRRQMEVYDSVKRKLDYQVEVAEVKKIFQQRNLVQWVTREVEKGLTPELKEVYLKLCIDDIQKLLKSNEHKT